MILSIGIAAYLGTSPPPSSSSCRVPAVWTPRGVLLPSTGVLLLACFAGCPRATPVAFWAIYSEKSTQVRSGVDLIKWEDQVNIREFRLYLVKCELEDWNGTWSATDDVSRVRKDASTDKYGH